MRAAEEYGMPMLILRPTIVESAMREPEPCVIRPPIALDSVETTTHWGNLLCMVGCYVCQLRHGPRLCKLGV